jgi:hypothetical protein
MEFAAMLYSLVLLTAHSMIDLPPRKKERK